MKNLFSSLMVLAVGFAVTGCAPSASQLKKVIEENPEIVFSAIEKHPDKFMKTVQEAAQKARAVEEENYRKEEETKREAEFKNPLKPNVDEKRAIKGSKTAKVTIVEYSDFQCPFCSRGHATMKKLLADYDGKVRVIFKNFPIERIHPNARIASQYYEAIALQDTEKANKFHDMIFDDQESLGEKGEAFLKELVKKVGANAAKVAKDITSDEVKKRIEEDKAEGEKFQFSGTPGYLINGVSLRGAFPPDEFKKIIDRHLSSN